MPPKPYPILSRRTHITNTPIQRLNINITSSSGTMRSSLQFQMGAILFASFSFAATTSPFAISPTQPPTASSTGVTPKPAKHWYDNVRIYKAAIVLLTVVVLNAALLCVWLCVLWRSRRNRTGAEDRSRAEAVGGPEEFELTPVTIITYEV